MTEKEYLLAGFKKCSSLKGGEQRKEMGVLVEDFVDFCWETFCQKENYKIEKGAKTPITIYGDYKESVDRHIFYKNELVLAIECKTYLDKCYLQRADSDFNIMKEKEENLTTIILSLQNATNEDTLQYFLKRKNIDKVFFLSDITRDSKHHISKNPSFLSEEKINIFSNFLQIFKA